MTKPEQTAPPLPCHEAPVRRRRRAHRQASALAVVGRSRQPGAPRAVSRRGGQVSWKASPRDRSGRGEPSGPPGPAGGRCAGGRGIGVPRGRPPTAPSFSRKPLCVRRQRNKGVSQGVLKGIVKKCRAQERAPVGRHVTDGPVGSLNGNAGVEGGVVCGYKWGPGLQGPRAAGRPAWGGRGAARGTGAAAGKRLRPGKGGRTGPWKGTWAVSHEQ